MNKVCEVYLAVDDEHGVELTLPVSQYEMMDAFEQLRAKPAEDVYWQVDEFYSFDYLAPHLDESMSIFEFNSLSEQLSKLDARQEIAMEGLLNMAVQQHMQENSGIITVPELMMLAANVNHCHVLTEVHTDEALGKFYADNDFLPELNDLPDSVYDLLDFSKIGKQMREVENGVFTRSGYVIQMEELKPLPEVQPQQEPSYMIRLTLESGFQGKKQAVLDLPATEAQLHELDWSKMKIVDTDSIAPQLNALLIDAEDLPRVNTLARSLRELKETGQLPKFKAVIQATDCKTLDDVFDRMEKLPQYCFEAKIRDIDKLVRDELEFVLGGNDAELIYKHLNREAYAKDILKQYGAKLTLYGMVNRADFGPLNEPIPEQEETHEPQMGM